MNLIKQYVQQLKIDKGCSLCGYNKSSYALHFAHIDPTTKYRNRNGKIVEPSDMIKGRHKSRYSTATIMAELEKCIILCANCHAEQTFYTQTV